MKKRIVIFLSVCLAILGSSFVTAGQEALSVNAWMSAQQVDKVTPDEDGLLLSVDSSDRRFTRLENTRLNIVSFFHQRKIGDVIVEKEFIRYQFETETGRLIEQTKNWREDLPDSITPTITRKQAESSVKGEVISSHLYILSPESEIFRIEPTPKNPCWVVRSIDGERRILTVIDSYTGEKLGYGIPAPWGGFSLGGPDHGSCDPYYTAYALNAEAWFESMGYDTERVDCPNDAKVQSHVQSDATVMFYELAHGGSTSFRNECHDDGAILSSQVESWISAYASMGFAFIGSCNGLCDITDGTFAYEFRKGSNIDAVAVGYCDMSSVALCADDCWPHAIAWQNVLFTYMLNGYSVGNAYGQANLSYPDCTDDGHSCTRIAGDPNLVFGGETYPKPRRSFCGAINDYDVPPFTVTPIYAVASRTYTRAHHIRCNSYVPAGETLTISASSGYPYNEVAFVNASRLTAYGALYAETGTGSEIAFVSASDRGSGIILNESGELFLYNQGAMKIH